MARVDLKQIAPSGATNGQIPKYNSTSGNWEPGSGTGYLAHKAGTVLKASFAGNPKTAQVTFSSAFPDTNYAISLTTTSSGNSGFGPVVNTKTASGFIINLMVNSITNLVAVDWVATKHGEST